MVDDGLSRRPGRCRSRRCRARSARSWPQNSAMAIALAMLGIAIYIWFRFEWQFGVGALLTLAHDVAMTLGLLRLHPAAGRPQRRRRVPDDRRLFAQRHGRHLRPHPRESAQIPQDGDPAAAQPVAQRDAGADGGDLADRADRARRADADRARGDLRPRHRDLPRRRSSAPIRRSTSRRRCWSGSASSRTASSRPTRRTSAEAQPA